MSEIHQILCPSCGASLPQPRGTTVLKCRFCKCEFRYSPPRKTTAEWVDALAMSDGEKAELTRILFRINEFAETTDFETLYAMAMRVLEIAPNRWEGYYHGARAVFWFNAQCVADFDVFFDNLNRVLSLLESCRAVSEDPMIVETLAEEIAVNLAEIANRGGGSDFAGENVRGSFKLFLLCRTLAPGHRDVENRAADYGRRFAEWTRERLEKEMMREGPKEFIPSEVYLEYLYYIHDLLGVDAGLADYARFGEMFLKNSRDSEAKGRVRSTLESLAETGLIAPLKPKSRFGWLGK